MKFSCDSCGAQYLIADEKLGPRGVKVRCKKCGHVIVVRRQAPEPAAESAPVAPEVSSPRSDPMLPPSVVGELGMTSSEFGLSQEFAAMGFDGLDGKSTPAPTVSDPAPALNGHAGAPEAPSSQVELKTQVAPAPEMDETPEVTDSAPRPGADFQEPAPATQVEPQPQLETPNEAATEAPAAAELRAPSLDYEENADSAQIEGFNSADEGDEGPETAVYDAPMAAAAAPEEALVSSPEQQAEAPAAQIEEDEADALAALSQVSAASTASSDDLQLDADEAGAAIDAALESAAQDPLLDMANSLEDEMEGLSEAFEPRPEPEAPTPPPELAGSDEALANLSALAAAQDDEEVHEEEDETVAADLASLSQSLAAAEPSAEFAAPAVASEETPQKQAAPGEEAEIAAELGSAFDAMFSPSDSGAVSPESILNSPDVAPPEMDPTRVFDVDAMAQVQAEQDLASPEAESGVGDWYVAINEEQIGPLSYKQVKKHWVDGDLSGDSLCWRQGMGDWTAIRFTAGLDELLKLTPETPSSLGAASQSHHEIEVIPKIAPKPAKVLHEPEAEAEPVVSVTPEAEPVPLSEPKVEPAAASSVVPTIEDDEDESSWRPSAASALASLAAEELSEPEEKPAASPAAASLSAAEASPKPITSSGGMTALPTTNNALETLLAGNTESSAAARFGAAEKSVSKVRALPKRSETVSSVPLKDPVAPPVAKDGGNRNIIIAAAILAFAILGGVAIAKMDFGGKDTPTPTAANAGVALAQKAPTQPTEPVANPEKAPTQPAEVKKPESEAAAAKPEEAKKAVEAAAKPEEKPAEQPKEPEAKAMVAAAAPVAAVAKPEPVKAEPKKVTKPKRKKRRRKGRSRRRRETRPERQVEPEPAPVRRDPPRPKPRQVSGEDDLLAVAGGNSRRRRRPTPEPEPDLPRQLDESDIFSVLRKNGRQVRACIKKQQKADPDLTGRMAVSMVIQKSGRPMRIKVSPEKFRGSVAARCLTSSARRWRFPKFSGPKMPIDFPVTLK